MTVVGNLRHRVIIQGKQTTPDGMGGFVEAWQDIATVWGDVRPLRGQERYVAQQAVSEVTHKVTIRYMSGIAPGNRILFDGRVFDILAVINVAERNRWLELLCSEVVA